MVLDRSSLRSRVEVGLHAPEGNRVSHRRFDEVGQGLALFEHQLQFGSKFPLDADLWDDSVFHGVSVLRMSYNDKGALAEGFRYRVAASIRKMAGVFGRSVSGCVFQAETASVRLRACASVRPVLMDSRVVGASVASNAPSIASLR